MRWRKSAIITVVFQLIMTGIVGKGLNSQI